MPLTYMFTSSSWIAVRAYGMGWQERQRPGALEFQHSRPLVILGPDGLVRTSCGLSADCPELREAAIHPVRAGRSPLRFWLSPMLLCLRDSRIRHRAECHHARLEGGSQQLHRWDAVPVRRVAVPFVGAGRWQVEIEGACRWPPGGGFHRGQLAETSPLVMPDLPRQARR